MSDGPPTRIDSSEPKRGWFGRRKDKRASEPRPAEPPNRAPEPSTRAYEPPASATPKPDAALAPPGFHVYRPTSADGPTNGSSTPDDQDR